MEQYIAPTHYAPEQSITLDQVTEGMKLEIHIRKGKYAGRELYFDVRHIWIDHIENTCGLIIYKRDLIKGMAEIRDTTKA